MANVIRIGVFFDGTGNNIWNDELIGDGSQTNIAKLYRMYQDANYKAKYEEGAGTEAYTEGHTFNTTQLTAIKNKDVYKDRKDYYALGGLAFGSTVKEHAVSMLDKIKKDINDARKENPDAQIVVDVYGFSRGATSARDFINMFNAQYADLNGSAIGFVGLFDTVATVGLANEYNANLNLNLNTNSADMMLHLTANDEFRANFPLNYMGSNGSNMIEIGMIGAHADVGGGYGNSVWDTQEKYIHDEVHAIFPIPALVEIAQQQRSDRINELISQATNQGFEYAYKTGTDRTTGALQLDFVFIETRYVNQGLSNNALWVMLNTMQQSGISIQNNVSTVPTNNSYIHTSYMDGKYGQSFKDWLAYRHEWSIDAYRDSYPDYPLKAEDKLLLLSAEDKTILHYLEADKYTIIGTEKEFDDITKNIVQNAPEFMTHRLEYITQLLSKDKATEGTLYQDHYSGKEYYGQTINGISLVDFAASGDNTLVYDNNNEGQIVYAKEGEDIVYTGGGDDILDGGAGNDILLGGEGFDAYYSDDGDTIDDSDGTGEVYFEGNVLTGGMLTGIYGNTKTYEGDGGIYILKSDNTLIFSKDGNFVTINNFDKKANDLGIELTGEELSLSIFAPVVSEADRVATGAITLSHAYGEDIIVTLYTQDDTAVAGSDYVARPTFDVHIAAGVTYAEFSISILDNQDPESTETFYALIDTVRTVNGESVDFTLVDVQPFTIEDDDNDEDDDNNNDGYVHVSVSDATRTEDNTMMRYDITLSQALEKDITIDLSTMDGSASGGLDYMGSQGSVTIRAGSTSGYYTVMIFEDEEIEGNETFSLTPTGYSYSGSESVLLDNTATGTIIDDDVPVEVTFSSAQASELSGAIHFTVSISKILESDLDIDFDTFDGTAIGGSDYAGLSGTVTIAAGSRTAEITIPLINDEIPEELESFSLAPTGYLYHGEGNLPIFFNNAATGTIIDDDDPEYILIHISDGAAGENAEAMTFNVTLTRALDQDITIHTSQGSTTISAGSTSGSVTMTWSDDCEIEPDSTFSVYPTGYSYNGTLRVLFANDATGTIYDDDTPPPPCATDQCTGQHAPCPPPPPRRDPLVLDMNKDGEISTVSLADSTAFFDITGDGIKEKVGWIQATDGIVVFDKNGNGKIDGISEVFGTATTSGFYELRQLADSNYDGVIDRRDELYNQLKVWQDTNQDGISQASELKTLSEAGVKNIELNVIGTNINLNGNLLSEAGRYGDTAGERELAADVELTFDTRITTIDTSLIPNYTEHPESKTLPNLRGYGVVMDTSIAYNINDTLRAMAIEYAADITKVASQFDAFMAQWSGLAQQVGYAAWSETQCQQWIYGRFVGTAVNSRSDVSSFYAQLTERSKAFFAFASLYPSLQEGVEFNREINEFVVSDVLALHKNTIEFMNDSTQSIEKKLFLADVMNTLEKTYLVFDPTKITASITDPLMRELISGIYAGTYKVNVYGNGTYASGNILAVGGEGADMITINGSSGSTILAGVGDDVIHGSTGNDVYLYRRGDGADTIIDGGGSDTLRLTDMMQSDIILRAEGKNLILARAEDGKAFEELSDKVTLINWAESANRIDAIRFSDGSSLDFTQVIRDYFITNGDDRFDLTSGADTIDSLEGNDVLHGLGGNDSLSSGMGDDIQYGDAGDDTLSGGDGNDSLVGGDGNDTLQGATGADALDGGSGNDTYLYSLGDGKDIITDGAGLDALQFGAGISVDSLVVQYLANGDMVIGLKEEGKLFTELSDTITIRGWNSVSNRLENILLSDGTAINLDALQIGTEGDDILTFGDNGVAIDLLGGNDTVTSGNGNDVIDSGAGNDTINVGNGINQITGGEGNDTVTAGSGADTISGGTGNDTINSGAGNDILSGNEGDDTLIAGDGNDTLNGAEGVDTLHGGLGDDLYLYNRGDGKDTIIDEYRYGYNGSGQSNAGNDILKFADGIGVDDLIAHVVGEDLIIALKEDGKTFNELSDIITIKNWVNTNDRIETIALFDGSVVDLAVIQSATLGNDNLVYGDSATVIDALAGDDVVITSAANDTVHGGDGNDVLRSGDGQDALYGDSGNDTLVAGSGNDILSGGEGSDTLYGENGNDTLAGTSGMDILAGALGDDIYIFALGDGRDTIIDEYAYGSGGNDTLRFGEGITKADLVARAVSGSKDLQIGVRESGKGFDVLSDMVTLKNWFDANKRIENITLFDGTVITLSEMQGGTEGDDYLVFGDSDTVIDAMGGNDTVITANGNDTLGAGTGNDILISNNGNDTLDGGEGNDTLKAGDGSDTLSGGAGTDTLEGGAGNDTYIFGRGDGKDRIIDSAGNDTIKFADGITKDDLVARFVSGSDDLQIGISEVGKTFDQLSDVITIIGWRNVGTRVENLRLSDGTAILLSEIERSTAGDDYLVFGDEGVTVDALAGNDTLITADGSDTANGGDGNDMILTLKGNDTLSGGKGTDTLKGGTGNDTYLFNRGDGADNVFDELGNDTLKFGDGITKDDLIFKQKGFDLVVMLKEAGKTAGQLTDTITLTKWFSDNPVETFSFSDGSTWSNSEIAAKLVNINIQDTLFSKIGSVMRGGASDDTYVYNQGDFTVVVDDQYFKDNVEIDAGHDKLVFASGVTKNDVTIGVNGNNLVIKIKSTATNEQLQDIVVIKEWKNPLRGIEEIVFSDGETLTIDKVGTYPAITLTTAWTNNRYYIYGNDNDTVTGTSYDEVFETNSGDDIINAGSGNDRICAGEGNDAIEGGAGNDVITMGTGDDYVTDVSGDDVYLFSKGDGKDIVYDYAGNDLVYFGEGIKADDLMLRQYGNDLVVGLKDGSKSFYNLSDKLTLKNWFIAGNRIETFKFTDNSTIGMDTIVSRIGTDNNDTISGIDSRNDILNGGKGNDTLNGLDGDDTLNGGVGNDTLSGGNGNDVYTFGRGDGNDVVTDIAGLDRIQLGEGIGKNDIRIERVANDLVVSILETGNTGIVTDTMTLKDWNDVNKRVEIIELYDGTKIQPEDILPFTDGIESYSFGSEDNTIHALGGNDVIYAGAGNDTIYGEAGNDNLQGQDGNDAIYGGEGNDSLYGQAGNDTLDGGIGNDYLSGEAGNDTYLFGRGDGKDTVDDSSDNDTLRFKDGITVNDILIKQIGNHLLIGLKEEGKTFAQLSDVITLNNWSYNGDGQPSYPESWGNYNARYAIDNFTFSDGTTWAKADIVAHIGTDENDVIFGLDGADTIGGGKGDDALYGRSGNDTYLFNRGDGKDTVFDAYYYGDAGNDTLKLGSDIDKNSVVFLMSGGNLIVDTGNGDTVTIQSQTSANNRIETIVSNDAAYMTYIDIERVIQDAQIYADENGIALTADNVRANAQLMNIMSSLWRDTLPEMGYGAPIVLDMNANGKTSVSLTDSHTYFDYEADGLKEHTAWIEKGDGLLVRDINNDGIINDGSELFGNKTKLSDGSLASDGYAALAQYDTNNDGVIDKNDTDFSQLKLLKDANLNGKTDAGELVDLSVAGITSLSLNRTDGSIYTQTTENGNIVTNETNYTTLTDTGTMRDVWFKIDATDTITDNDTLYGTTEEETLSGDVGNDTYVITYGGGKDSIDDNGNGADTIKFLSGITTDRLIVQWVRGTDDLRIGIRENAEDDTPITELANTITIKNWFNDTGAIEQFTFSDGTTLNRQGIYNQLLNVEGDVTARVLDKDGSLAGNSGNDILYGVDGNELLTGKEGDDYLRGLAGDDYLSAGAGDDMLDGGAGNDVLEGGLGDDYYLFNKGDGKDLIIDSGGMDTLYFGEGITSRDVIINEIGEDLILSFTYDSATSIDKIDQITIKNWTTNDFKIESLSFSDSKEYSISELIEKNTNHTPEMFFEESERNLAKDRSAKGILLADDIDGDILTYTVTSAPTMGTISINQCGIWTYTGISRDAGTDTVNIVISDGRGGEVTTTLSFIMEALNQAPEAPSDVTNTLQDIRILTGEVGASDIDGNVLNYIVTAEASHGTLSVNESGVWSYSATDGYMGTDSAIITIDDGNGGVITQTLNFDVKVSAPTLADSTSGLLEDTSTKGVFNVTNPIGGVLLYEVLGASSKGAFSVNEAGEWSYAPNADLNGLDSVTIKVTNAYGLSTTATLNLAIEAVNDAPILTQTPSPITLNAGASANGNIKASDIDGDTLSYSVTSTPEHGTLSINENGEWSYSAERYFAGESSATISIDDGHGGSVITTLNFTSLMTPDWHYTYGGQSMTINDSDGQDLLIMDTISMGDLTFLQDGNNLRIDVKDKNDIILTDYFTSPTKGVESLQTKEGMINLSKERIGTIGNFWNFGWGSNKADLISGKSSADTIYAGEGNDVIFGNAGNDALSGSNDNDLLIGGEGHDTLSGGNNDDILYGDNGNDTLSGEAGNDKLFGDKGNDSLSGGEGNDLLNGGEGTNSLSGSSGNDTYLFTKGATDTTINENMFGFNLFGRWIGQNGGNDIVKFGEGITKEDISFLMKGNDLLLQYGDSAFITINNQKNQATPIERLQLDDGSYLSNTDIDQIVQQINAYSKDHGFHLKDNTQIQNNQALMNIVASGWHQ